MVALPPHYRRTLTGRIRPRCTWMKKVLMQVEVRCETISPIPTHDGSERPALHTSFEWRDATIEDLLDKVYSPAQETATNQPRTIEK